MKIGKTPSSSDGVLHRTPEAFNRIEVVPTVGGQQMQAKLIVPMRQCRGQFFGAMDPTASDDHHDLFPGFAKNSPHLMEILAKFVGIKVRHDFMGDFGRSILYQPNDTEQHAGGDTAPGAIASPRTAFESLGTLHVTLAQRPRGEAIALGAAPPAQPGEGKAPQERFILVE